MDFACIFFGVLFIIFGAWFFSGKAIKHLKIWKAMSLEEKRKVKIKPLCRNIGEVIMLCGLIYLLKGLFLGFKNQAFVFTMIAWLVIAGLDVYYIAKSKRYKREEEVKKDEKQ